MLSLRVTWIKIIWQNLYIYQTPLQHKFTESVKERFDVKTTFLVYHGVVSCIKLLRNANENQDENNWNFSTFVHKFIKGPKSNRLAYEKLVSSKQSSPNKSQEKWCVDCSLQCSKTIDWERAYKLPFCSTNATKLIISQFKLLHRRLATNDFLNKIDIRENDICTCTRFEPRLGILSCVLVKDT